MLIEEYLDGPEYSVDCITWQGETLPLVIAEKELAFPPYFEEFGHVVSADPGKDLAAAIDMVVRAHKTIGLDRLASHTEVKLTSRGLRIVEINPQARRRPYPVPGLPGSWGGPRGRVSAGSGR